MSKVGSEGSPIRLTPDVSKRALFEQGTNIDCVPDAVVAINRIKAPKKSFDLYFNNLLWNPNLDADEIRVGYLLYELIEDQCSDPIFLVAESFHMSRVGEDGVIHVRSISDTAKSFESADKQSLLNMLHKHRMKINTEDLISILNKLHSFFYITCTEICESNLDADKVGFDYKKEQVLLSNDTKLVHVRLNHHFDRINMINRWIALPKAK